MSGKSQEKKKEATTKDLNPVVDAETSKRFVSVSFCFLISIFIYFLLGKHLMINLICLQIVGIYWEMILNRVFKKQKTNLMLN